MTARSKWRGHSIKLVNNVWVYDSDDKPVSLDQRRPCAHCGMAETQQGYDACIGEISGATNACCGHGDSFYAYIKFRNGNVVAGQSALDYFIKLGK